MAERIIVYLVLILLLFRCQSETDNNSGRLNTDVSQLQRNKNINRQFPSNSEKIIVGLLYHRFGEYRYPSTSINPDLFEEHLQYLVDHNISTGTLSDCLKGAYNDSISDRSVAITIDDAFLSFYRVGFPLLKKYGIEATLFINTETVGSGDYMNWDQLREVNTAGIEIGNHTHSHDYFLNIPDSLRLNLFKKDVTIAQELIRENLNLETNIFAYPYGEYDSAMVNYIKESGFLGAAAQNSGVISKYSSPFTVPRFPMTNLYGSKDRFIEKINMDPLPVIKIVPNVTVPSSNPPELTIFLDKHILDFSRLQCFIQGSNCNILEADESFDVIKVKAGSVLPDRRHLYTITLPDSESGKWHWFSHQWVFPNRKDK